MCSVHSIRYARSDERLGQHAGLQRQIVIKRQQQEQRRIQRRLVADLLIDRPLPPQQLSGREHAIAQIGGGEHQQEAHVGVRLGIHAVVRHQQILQQSNAATEKRQQNDHDIQQLLCAGLFLFFQILQLLPGQSPQLPAGSARRIPLPLCRHTSTPLSAIPDRWQFR